MATRSTAKYFEVWRGPTAAKRYRIYGNGQIEGFDYDARVINGYPSLVTRALRRYASENGIAFEFDGATNGSTSSCEGAEHSTGRKSENTPASPAISAALGEK